MNSFLLSNNPPAAVWKTALRMLGIVMLSFLFISEGWGRGDQPLDVRNLMTDNVFLTYKARTDGTAGYAWYYKVGENGKEEEFSGKLTTGDSVSYDYFFTIQNSTNENTTAELTLDYFIYVGTNGVFRITGPNPVKITANRCSLENKNNGTIGQEKEQKSVIYVEDGSNLELHEGEGGMIVRNTSQENLIYGLYNGGTTTLSGWIEFYAQNGSGNSDAYAIYNPTNSTLKATTGSDIKAAGDDLSYDGTYQSPFMCWHFNNTLEAGKSLSINQLNTQGETEVASFKADGESTTFLILGEVSASYAVYFNGVKQMGKKQTSQTDYEDSYTNTFAATTDGTETNTKQHSFYGQVTAHPTVYTPNELRTAITSSSTVSGSPTKITLGADIDLSSLTSDLTIDGKYIEIDGGGHTITPHTERGFFFTASAGSLKLTNVTVDFEGNPRAGTNAFIDVDVAGTEIILGTGFRMINGASNEGNKKLPYGVNMSAGTLIMEGDAEITGSTDEEGCAVKLLSAATLKLRGGKIHGISGTGLYLKKDGNSNPQVIIEQSLANSQFDGICLVDYLDAQNNISDDVVISASTSPDYPITVDDLSKLGLKPLERSGSAPVLFYELYLDTDNTIKLQGYPLDIDGWDFGNREVGYPQWDAQPITLSNSSDSPLIIDNVTLAGEDKDKFMIISSGNTETVPAGGTNTNYAVRPINDLPIDRYHAVIQVTAKGHTGIYEASVYFEVTSGPDNPGPDDPDPTPTPEYVYYQVLLPQVTGATTDPVAGTYLVGEGDAFRFNLTLDDDYNLSVPVVQAGDKVLQPDAYGYYLIPNVWHDQTITVTGIALNPVDPPSANADLDEPVKVWAEGHTLYIYTASRETIRLYTFSGQLLRQIDNTGRIAIPDLPEGNYLIRIGGRTWKVAL